MGISNIELVSTRNEVLRAEDNAELIRSVFEERVSGRMYNPLDDPMATEKLRSQVDLWKEEGSTVVMVFGCFDAPFHVNHQRFLFDCKLQGVAKYYDKVSQEENLDESWQSLDTASKKEFAKAVLDYGAVKLVVSTDGDDRIASSKGYAEDKGGSPRPLLSWRSRTENILGLSLGLDDSGNQRSPIVDAVTMHDHFSLPGTVHASTVDMVADFQPDVWALYHEAEGDILAASNDPRLSRTDIVVIDSPENYSVVDPRTGRPFSTTDLVRRVKGEI